MWSGVDRLWVVVGGRSSVDGLEFAAKLADGITKILRMQGTFLDSRLGVCRIPSIQ